MMDSTFTVMCTHCPDERIELTAPDLRYLLDDGHIIPEEWAEYHTCDRTDDLDANVRISSFTDGIETYFPVGFDEYVGRPLAACGDTILEWMNEVNQTDEHTLGPFIALAENHHAPQYITSYAFFADRYVGMYPSFEDYMLDMINDDREGFFGNLSDDDDLVRYFDYDSYISDRRHDYTIIEVPSLRSDMPAKAVYIYHD